MEVKSKFAVISMGSVNSDSPELVQHMVLRNNSGDPVEFPALLVKIEDKYTFVKRVTEMAAQLWDAVELNRVRKEVEDGYAKALEDKVKVNE